MSTLELPPDQLLTTTRTVRKRLDLERPVPLDLIRECIEIAVQAPSGSNGQTWHWMVITEVEKRAAIGEYYQRSLEKYFADSDAAGKVTEGDPERVAVQRRVRSSSAYLGERMGQVPVLVIPCIPAASLPEGNQAALWGSILPAAWSYMLAARSRALGTAWTTLHLRYEREISELLGLPEDLRQAVLIPTAYSIGTSFKPAARKPLDDILHFDAW
ncbi:nitroreductase [Kribbella sp. VKM Ac-2527]|uniref:Nitroreductase n=1 Tax=Kribbella caucasensis TaxID=2512215 RepID=A0A4R6J5E3_9ACTN|nr:nitroreductase family protein [Kribbella sp. VKM Ac-2527]TDO30633.1 nitroreductase [Kribbella sp. VKM Ac-2527]